MNGVARPVQRENVEFLVECGVQGIMKMTMPEIKNQLKNFETTHGGILMLPSMTGNKLALAERLYAFAVAAVDDTK